MRIPFLAACVWLMSAIAAGGQGVGQGVGQGADHNSVSLSIQNPWARATPPNAHASAAYMTIVNKGSEPDRLIGVSSPLAPGAELHRTMMEDGIMRMRPVDWLEIAPGQTVELGPGGEHIMLMGLSGPLVQGDRITLMLEFERAGPMAVQAPIEPIGFTGY